MTLVRFIAAGGSEVDVEAQDGDRLLDVAQRAGQPLEGTCGGDMACATCHEVSPGTTLTKNSCGLVSVTILSMSAIEACAGIVYWPGSSLRFLAPSSSVASRKIIGWSVPSSVKPWATRSLVTVVRLLPFCTMKGLSVSIGPGS